MVTRRGSLERRARIEAEAAAWLARLHGPERNEAAERGFKAWISEDIEHARAFEVLTEIWEGVGGAAPRQLRRAPTARSAVLAGVVLALFVVGVVGWIGRDPVHSTGRGEQKSVVLSDGSRLTLNTDSRVVVDYEANARRVRLERGEVLFEVAKNPARPFVVSAGDEQVRALGTTFLVRREPAAVLVTLVEGKVSVSGDVRRLKPTVLAPGQRLTVRAEGAASLDRPPLERVTAWRRGEAVFDDVTLAEAASELGRYGGPRVVVRDPAVSALRVSGAFSTGDAREFALAVAELHGLRVEDRGSELVLDRR